MNLTPLSGLRKTNVKETMTLLQLIKTIFVSPKDISLKKFGSSKLYALLSSKRLGNL